MLYAYIPLLVLAINEASTNITYTRGCNPFSCFNYRHTVQGRVNKPPTLMHTAQNKTGNFHVRKVRPYIVILSELRTLCSGSSTIQLEAADQIYFTAVLWLILSPVLQNTRGLDRRWLPVFELVLPVIFYRFCSQVISTLCGAIIKTFPTLSHKVWAALPTLCSLIC